MPGLIIEELEPTHDYAEISDHTILTDFERCVAKIEEVINFWFLNDSDNSGDVASEISMGEWHEKCEVIKFGITSFTMRHFFINQQSTVLGEDSALGRTHPFSIASMLNQFNDFPAKAPPLAHWFGLCEFIVVITDDIPRMQSAVCVALASTKCSVATFLQSTQSIDCSAGICLTNGFRTTFSISHSDPRSSDPLDFRQISNIFEEKLALKDRSKSVYTIASRLTFSKDDLTLDWHSIFPFASCLSKQSTRKTSALLKIPRFADVIKSLSNHKVNSIFPTGIANEMLKSISLQAKMPYATNELDEVSQDCGDPSLAIKWNLIAETPRLIRCQTVSGSVFRCILEIVDSLSMKLDSSDRAESRLSLGFATSTTFGLIKTITSKVSQKAQEYVSKRPVFYDNEIQSLTKDLFSIPCLEESTSDMKFKSAPNGSLVYNLAVFVSHLINEIGFVDKIINTISLIRNQLLTEIYYHWDEKIKIYSVPGVPNDNYCLFVQLFQLFNQFIECWHCRNEQDSLILLKLDSLSFDVGGEGCGRIKQFGHEKSTFDGSQLYEPKLKNCSMITPDLHHLFTFLGSEPNFVKLLKSDMEAFKAANPWSSIFDFIRWYSPKDVWRNGFGDWQLSERMSVPGNVWQTTWDDADAICADQQDPDLDGIYEKDMILRLFEELSPARIVSLLIPMFIHLFVDQIRSEANDHNIAVDEDLLTKAEELSKHSFDFDPLPKSIVTSLTELSEKFCKIENEITIRRVLYSLLKLDKKDETHRNIVNVLADNGRIELSADEHGDFIEKHVKPLFTAEENTWTEPKCKEYILRTSAAKPNECSRSSPQRMYCLLSQNELRLCGAFTHDTISD